MAMILRVNLTTDRDRLFLPIADKWPSKGTDDDDRIYRTVKPAHDKTRWYIQYIWKGG